MLNIKFILLVCLITLLNSALGVTNDQIVFLDSCTIDSGQKGECISTSACSTQGGHSEAGHCPGAADIQCCTYGSCTASGVKGECQPTSTCSGKSTVGYAFPLFFRLICADCEIDFVPAQRTSNAALVPVVGEGDAILRA
jgi:hypothetical protein